MIKFLKEIICKLLNIDSIFNRQNDLKVLIGLSLLNKINDSQNINDHELKIFSQFGEDGIIDYLLKKIKSNSKNFIEFGVEDYEESNTRFLLEARNWRGLILDGSEIYIEKIKKKNFYWRYNLIVKKEFVTAENINTVIKENKLPGNIGLLSIDIDGNDYWVWKELSIIRPEIVIIEYNARFGSTESVVVPYKKNFNRKNAHFSSIYFGASLRALYNLGVKKNYSLVATNLNGNNAFFIDNDVLKNTSIKSLSPEKCFNINSFNELRDKHGNISDRDITKELEILKKLPLEIV